MPLPSTHRFHFQTRRAFQNCTTEQRIQNETHKRNDKNVKWDTWYKQSRRKIGIRVLYCCSTVVESERGRGEKREKEN